MDYQQRNAWVRIEKQWLTIAFKIFSLIVALWLINVVFVATHEAGHATTAAAFGATIYDIQVSPAGVDGSTTHTMLKERYQISAVLIGGIVFSLAATIIAYAIRFDLAVYILGLRTLESAINYTQNSDMSTLYAMFGQSILAVTGILSITIILVVASTFHRRYTASKPVEVRGGLKIAGPTPVA